ncbi:hypothetical protein CXK86_11350 [Paenibacillus sp. BGI2013]|uniref:AAA family ATPase n=1 Tax=Paenibacillus sp. BGI2013 TaxID=2058902 RepID=UPI000C6DA38E|nr:hypothetical protein [Paenibacillus sp. BGI2013]PKQ90635.1 hypothetical protein CXK86_11350 [Paenibacillus sp. BGI2013]
MNDIYTEIEKWLSKRPLWLQDAASRLLKNDLLSDEDVSELILLCKAEGGITESNKEFQTIEAGDFSSKDSKSHYRIDEIHSVKGINALSPRKPLSFVGNLTVVYGQNGSGKSSYVRLLKHMAGAKKSGTLMGNVFNQEPQPQECTISITTSEQTDHTTWTPTMGTLKELSTLQLYDTDCANLYVNEEKEVAYEPWLLQFFSKLSNTCTQVGQAIKNEMDTIQLKQFNPPGESTTTQSVLWLNSINHSTSCEEINNHCLWTESDEDVLRNFKQQISEVNPNEKMEYFRKTVSNISQLKDLLSGVFNSLSDNICEEILIAKSDIKMKKQAAEKDAQKVFDGLPLEGVGTESWKLLWERARQYSEQHAYSNEKFPFTSSDSHCVLCQQPLSQDTQDRLSNFESYVKSTLNREVQLAEEKLSGLLKTVKQSPDGSKLDLYFNSIGVTSEDEKDNITEFCNTLQERYMSLSTAELMSELVTLPLNDVLVTLNEAAVANQEQASVYQELSRNTDREDLKNRILELEARKWLHHNKNDISDKVKDLQRINKFKSSLNLTNTQQITTKKSSLSDELITTEYIKRFQNELKDLGGSKIKVELVKTKSQKGRIYHQVKLLNCPTKVRTSEVLSEGEFRIVSLAGFLADVDTGLDKTPFIFDDPISSLDQFFEENTVKRLVKLSLTRQVIVFTHRISFLTLLNDAAKELGVKCNETWLKSEPWGAGEPGQLPLYSQKPLPALNSLLNDRVTRAEKVLNELGRTEYDLLAKGICSDFRILIERFIESELLSEVVLRFRRSVTTMNRIQKLALITPNDCKIFEDYMTKYSTYEHSQPHETPVELPEPDELKADMQKVISWSKEFRSRAI